jgi:hypothetical protein
MKNKKEKIVYWKLSALKELKNNPNKMTQGEFEQLKISMKKFEAVEPIIVNVNSKRRGNIIGGHHRKKAAIEVGWTEFPCIERNLSEKDERELSLRMNKNRGRFDDLELKRFDRAELMEVGFDFREMEKIYVDKNKVEQGEKYSKMELQPYESYDYVVIMFKNSFDWTKAVQLFGLKDVNYSATAKVKKIGIGRILDGEKFLKKFADSKGDFKQGKK